MISTPDRPTRIRPRSIWTYAPYLWIITSCELATLVIIFDGGGLLPSPQFILALALLGFTPLYWLVMVVFAMFSRKWKRLAAIIASGIIAVSMVYFSWKFRNEVHFLIMRPIYDKQLAHEKNVTTESWNWYEGSGWYLEVEYVKNLALAPPPTEQDDQGCTDTSQRLGGNFFLKLTNCD
jgi:hypothetical protein